MKSINTKISIIIISGLLLQIILAGSLYRILVAKQILSSVNSHESARQEILQGAILKIEQSGNNVDTMQRILNSYSKKYDVSFVLKDMDGNTVISAEPLRKTARNIQEMGFVKFGKKPAYILYSSFPLKLKNLSSNRQAESTRFYMGIVIILVSSIISFLVYEVLTTPIKKLRKAIGKVNYGNTLVEIPYHANDEFGLLCRNFEDMGRRLKKSEESQTEIIQAISHDLKTPLTSIIGYIKRIMDGKVTNEEKIKEYCSIIYRKANDVKNLLDELDEYTSINFRSKYKMEIVNCKEFFENVCREFKDEALQRDVILEYENKLQESYSINIDKAKIRRVFGNIIENSIKYSGEGSRIFITCTKDGGNILFEACDNGPGVPEEQLEKIFDRFYRVDTSRSREKGGTGLGLAICKGIIEGHGGRIGARNRESGGFCIYFTIPVSNQ